MPGPFVAVAFLFLSQTHTSVPDDYQTLGMTDTLQDCINEAKNDILTDDDLLKQLNDNNSEVKVVCIDTETGVITQAVKVSNPTT